VDPDRKSDRPIIAKKSSKGDGAKEPDREHASVDMKREPIEREFYYGISGKGLAHREIGKGSQSA
jgi:hypothetical protein